ncbi:MAG TPA: 7TM domain-containing protein [Candidatus Woesebacteria bacterium]|nr:7TM domain-containing protein [Candidatus Woesebacteria bacterium]
MKKVLMGLAILLVVWGVFLTPKTLAVAEEITPQIETVETATLAAETVPVKEIDLTVPTQEGDRLTKLLNGQKLSGWWGKDVLKIAMRKAVSEGVSPNTLVLLFLFPLVAALVAFSRQVVGVSGFGIITPALLSVAFLSTGGLVGMVLMIFILGVATFARSLIKKIKIPYLSKLAILIWIISMAVLVLLLVSPMIGLERLMSVGIFPIMLFVLLAETFIEAQITRSVSTSMWMTIETVILALVAYKLLSAPWIQSQVILHPEISVIVILIVDLLIGRYKGLRLSEVWRFRKIVYRK